jgi:hypothetical protein
MTNELEASMHTRNLTLLLLLTAALPVPALAVARQDVQAGMARCAVIADDRQYLDCLYGAAQPLRAQLGLPPAPATQIRLVPPATLAARPLVAAVPAAPPPKRGFLANLVGSDNHGALHIATYSFDKRGMFTVTLSDGEILRQADNDIHYAHWHAVPKGTVSVIDDSLGGQTIQIDGEQDPYLVRRVR